MKRPNLHFIFFGQTELYSVVEMKGLPDDPAVIQRCVAREYYTDELHEFCNIRLDGQGGDSYMLFGDFDEAFVESSVRMIKEL